MALYDFTKIELLDIEGNPASLGEGQEPVHKSIARTIYNLCFSDITLAPKAREIFAGNPVELDKVEIQTVLDVVNHSKSPLLAFVRQAVSEYIESVKGKS